MCFFKITPFGCHQALQVGLDPKVPMRSKARLYEVTEDIYL